MIWNFALISEESKSVPVHKRPSQIATAVWVEA
jgi:hypothetical protein